MNEKSNPSQPSSDITLQDLRDFVVLHALTWNFSGRVSDHPFWKRLEAQLSDDSDSTTRQSI